MTETPAAQYISGLESPQTRRRDHKLAHAEEIMRELRIVGHFSNATSLLLENKDAASQLWQVAVKIKTRIYLAVRDQYIPSKPKENAGYAQRIRSAMMLWNHADKGVDYVQAEGKKIRDSLSIDAETGEIKVVRDGSDQGLVDIASAVKETLEALTNKVSDPAERATICREIFEAMVERGVRTKGNPLAKLNDDEGPLEKRAGGAKRG